MKIEHYVVGVVGTNCYFAINEQTKECIIIDPGDEAARLAEKIQAGGYTPAAVLLTHAHFDHIMGVDALAGQYGIPVYVHADDADMLQQPEVNCGAMIGTRASAKADKQVHDGDTVNLAGMEIQVIHTPGHTAGGTCYYIESDKTLMSGDTLFAGSVGRTDYPTASSAAMMESLHDKLCKLPDDTDVYPGHGEFTTIGYEKQNNPFM